MPLVIGDALGRLPIPPVRIQVNNRKLCEGFYRGLASTDTEAALRAVDKLDKIGPDEVADAAGRDRRRHRRPRPRRASRWPRSPPPDASFVDAVRALGVGDPLLDEGLAELVRGRRDGARRTRPACCVADLKIARGLDYYTGTVYETQLRGLRAVRLDLLRRAVRQPGHRGHRAASRASASRSACPGCSGCSSAPARCRRPARCRPACWSRCRPRSSARGCDRIAAALRRRGIATEVSPTAAKYGKQIRYAERRGIPYVWFPGVDGAADTVKDIRSGDQVEADASAWAPPADDLRARVIAG